MGRGLRVISRLQLQPELQASRISPTLLCKAWTKDLPSVSATCVAFPTKFARQLILAVYPAHSIARLIDGLPLLFCPKG